jgi:hypothetical protein
VSNNDYLRRGEPHEEAVDTRAEALTIFQRLESAAQMLGRRLLDDQARDVREAADLLCTMQSQLEAARRDAERYRWLRSADGERVAEIFGIYANEAFDAAIDAAIASAGGKA